MTAGNCILKNNELVCQSAAIKNGANFVGAVLHKK
jgi:hypothetical protein